MIEKDPKARVWAIPAPGGGSRAFCDRMNAWAQGEGQPGLGYIFWRNVRAGDQDGEETRQGRQGADRARADAGDHGGRRPDRQEHRAGARRSFASSSAWRWRRRLLRRRRPGKFYKFAGEARTKVGRELKLVDEDRFEFCWIVDFPMYEWNEEEKKIDFSHNPFSMPQGELEALEARRANEDPLEILAYQYDIVCNGVRAVLGRDPEPPARDHAEGLRDRRLRTRRWWKTSSAAC